MILKEFFNKKYKYKLSKLFLLIFLVYLYIFLINSLLFLSNIIGKNKFAKIEKKSIVNSIPEKVLAIKSGFLPYFVPNIIVEKVYDLDSKDLFFPIGTLPNQITYLENEGYGLIKYKSDRFGLRNKDLKWNNLYKNKNIFLLGDSFIHGYAVKENFTISEIVERKTNINTFNIGNGGNGPYEYSANIKTLLAPIIKKSTKKNKIILFIYDNDNEKYNKQKEFLLSSVEPIIKNNSINNILATENYINNLEKLINNSYDLSEEGLIKDLKKWKNWRLKNRTLLNLFSLQKVRSRIKILKDKNNINYINLPIQNTLNSLKNNCRNPCQAYVAYIPNSSFWRPNKKAKDFKKYVKDISMNLDLIFIDGEEVLDKNNNYNYAPKGPHLSITGYSKLANFISDKIK